MRSFRKPRFSNTLKIRTISILLIDSIAEDHHLTVEADTRTTAEATIIQTIDEVDFEADQMVDFNQIVARKDASYVGNLVVDQPIIQKRAQRLEKALFRSIPTV
jgi:hypothetical protein